VTTKLPFFYLMSTPLFFAAEGRLSPVKYMATYGHLPFVVNTGVFLQTTCKPAANRPAVLQTTCEPWRKNIFSCGHIGLCGQSTKTKPK